MIVVHRNSGLGFRLFGNLVLDEVSRKFFKHKHSQVGETKRQESEKWQPKLSWDAESEKESERERASAQAEPARACLMPPVLRGEKGDGAQESHSIYSKGKIFGCTWPWLCPLGLESGGSL